MMRMRTKATEVTGKNGGSSAAGDGGGDNELEVRPGGMLVQKRDPDSENRVPPPTIRVRVKYKSIYHEIRISSQATFGELKKMLTGPTGLHHEDQKLMYKDKERNSKTFLDVVGVKDRSKMVLEEDPISKEKRYLEKKKNAKTEKAAKSISEISLEVDRLAGQVSAFESVVSIGGKVAENMVSNLIELLMNQLLKLDEIIVEGDINLQKKKQVKRVQEYVEALDVLKIKNSKASSNINGNHLKEQRHSNGQGGTALPTEHHHYDHQPPLPQSQQVVMPPQQQQPSRKSSSGAVVVTTQWETFDPMPTTSTPGSSNTIHPMFNWDLL